MCKCASCYDYEICPNWTFFPSAKASDFSLWWFDIWCILQYLQLVIIWCLIFGTYLVFWWFVHPALVAAGDNLANVGGSRSQACALLTSGPRINWTGQELCHKIGLNRQTKTGNKLWQYYVKSEVQNLRETKAIIWMCCFIRAPVCVELRVTGEK